jgi:hypothetical protein
MKYFSLDSVLASFEANKAKISDGFWGIMAISLSLDCEIIPCKQYNLDCNKIASILENWFSIRETCKIYNMSSSWYVVYSNSWIEHLSLFFKKNQKPNIFDVICWMYQCHAFEDTPTSSELLSLFIKDTSMQLDKLNSVFDITPKDYNFSDSKFSHTSKIQRIEQNYGTIENNSAIKSNGSYLVAEAGSFQRAPFIQTLYASTENFKCLMVTNSAPDVYYPDNFSDNSKTHNDIAPLQVIYYGAPGTGKSHQTDSLVDDDPLNKFHQRTTFHPDSDYSSFVGCYKPSKENGELTYKFVPQVFLKSYVEAWKNQNKPYYLIIEEINRGNCAQIFGDIFQLLDRREDGFSKYHISTDTDIAAYLREDAFANVSAEDIPSVQGINIEQILNGEIMQLPSNMHIYATMNTSDQSLFPIDSAFKRRWEWEYIPIKQPKDGKFRDWKIVTNDGVAYDWWAFLTAVNSRIFDTTQSEDKKMGYWFTKADAQKNISQKKFIGKVLFYLWNDVFKDYIRTENTIFKVFKDTDKKETEEYTFTDFFSSVGVTERIHRLMFTLGVRREDLYEPSNDKDEDEPAEATGEKYNSWKSKHQEYWDQLQQMLEATNIPKAENVSYYAAYYLLPVFGNPNLTLAFFHYTHKGRNKVCVGLRWEKAEDVSVWDKIAELKDEASEKLGLPMEIWNEERANSMVIKLENLNFKDAESTDKSLLWLAEQGEAIYEFFQPRLVQGDEAAD